MGNLGHRYGDLCVHTHDSSSLVTVSIDGLRDRIISADGQITRLTSGLPFGVPERDERFVVGRIYRAKDLPAGAVVRTMGTESEYVRCTNIDSLMRWEQPIPGSGEWMVEYVDQLPRGERMTEREKREVEEAKR